MKRILKFGICLIVALAFLGCSTPTPPTVPPSSGGSFSTSPASGKELEKEKMTVNIDPYLLKDCAILSHIKDNPTPNDVLNQKSKDVEAYSECYKRHRALVKIVRDAFNLK